MSSPSSFGGAATDAATAPQRIEFSVVRLIYARARVLLVKMTGGGFAVVHDPAYILPCISPQYAVGAAARLCSGTAREPSTLLEVRSGAERLRHYDVAQGRASARCTSARPTEKMLVACVPHAERRHVNRRLRQRGSDDAALALRSLPSAEAFLLAAGIKERCVREVCRPVLRECYAHPLAVALACEHARLGATPRSLRSLSGEQLERVSERLGNAADAWIVRADFGLRAVECADNDDDDDNQATAPSGEPAGVFLERERLIAVCRATGAAHLFPSAAADTPARVQVEQWLALRYDAARADALALWRDCVCAAYAYSGSAPGMLLALAAELRAPRAAVLQHTFAAARGGVAEPDCVLITPTSGAATRASRIARMAAYSVEDVLHGRVAYVRADGSTVFVLLHAHCYGVLALAALYRAIGGRRTIVMVGDPRPVSCVPCSTPLLEDAGFDAHPLFAACFAEGVCAHSEPLLPRPSPVCRELGPLDAATHEQLFKRRLDVGGDGAVCLVQQLADVPRAVRHGAPLLVCGESYARARARKCDDADAPSWLVLEDTGDVVRVTDELTLRLLPAAAAAAQPEVCEADHLGAALSSERVTHVKYDAGDAFVARSGTDHRRCCGTSEHHVVSLDAHRRHARHPVRVAPVRALARATCGAEPPFHSVVLLVDGTAAVPCRASICDVRAAAALARSRVYVVCSDERYFCERVLRDTPARAAFPQLSDADRLAVFALQPPPPPAAAQNDDAPAAAAAPPPPPPPPNQRLQIVGIFARSCLYTEAPGDCVVMRVGELHRALLHGDEDAAEAHAQQHDEAVRRDVHDTSEHALRLEFERYVVQLVGDGDAPPPSPTAAVLRMVCTAVHGDARMEAWLQRRAGTAAEHALRAAQTWEHTRAALSDEQDDSGAAARMLLCMERARERIQRCSTSE